MAISGRRKCVCKTDNDNTDADLFASGVSCQEEEGRTEASGTTTTTTIATTATTTEATAGDPSRAGAVEEETLPIINTRCVEPKRLGD